MMEVLNNKKFIPFEGKSLFRAFFMMLVFLFIGVAVSDRTAPVYRSYAKEEDGDLSDYSNKLQISVGEDGELTGDSIIDGDKSKNATVKTGNKILNILTALFSLVLGGAGIVLGIIFITHCVSLAKNGTSPQGKSMSVNGLILTGIAAALCGGAGVFIALFFNIFR